MVIVWKYGTGTSEYQFLVCIAQNLLPKGTVLEWKAVLCFLLLLRMFKIVWATDAVHFVYIILDGESDCGFWVNTDTLMGREIAGCSSLSLWLWDSILVCSTGIYLTLMKSYAIVHPKNKTFFNLALGLS